MSLKCKNSYKRVSLHFESDSETTVSLETVNSMTSVLGLLSLEALIFYALVKLKNDLKITHPQDDGLSTADHLAAIGRFTPQDLPLTKLSSLFNEVANERAIKKAKEYSLEDMLSQVAEENMHDHIGLSRSLDMQVNDRSSQESNFHYAHSSFNESPPINEAENFTVQITLESPEQANARWRQQMRAIDIGESLTKTKRLSFEDWGDFLSIFSNEGKAIVEALRKG